MSAFYNEIDPYAAQWLRNLITAGHIAPGVVDERPIQEIEAWELAGFTQCHFFAGIGIWSLALRRAGWPDDRPIWTGSCPCQPFSSAGKRKGISDDRHLWPYWFALIEQRKPPIVVGEQVASKDGLGWFDLVSTDMEAASYAIGASDLCAAGFKQAHLRQRLYFIAVAHTYSRKWAGFADPKGCKPDRETSGRVESNCSPTGSSAISRLADDDDARRQGWSDNERNGSSNQCTPGPSGVASELGNAMRDGNGPIPGNHYSEKETIVGNNRNIPRAGTSSLATSAISRMADCERNGQHGAKSAGETGRSKSSNRSSRERNPAIRNPGEIDERWLALDWLLCRNPAGEPSWRPVEPGTFPLAHGIASRVGKLRAYGNGLDAETATQFCEVVKEIADGV